MSTSACPLILYCRSGVTAGVTTELPCSIILAGSDRNGRRSKGLSRWPRNVCRWSWWRSDVDTWLFRGMIPSWTAQENDRKNDIESIIRSNQWSTNRDLPNKRLGTSEQPRTIDQSSDQGRATHPRAIGSRQSKQLIWEQSDCDRRYLGTIDQTRERVRALPEVGNRCEFWIRG